MTYVTPEPNLPQDKNAWRTAGFWTVLPCGALFRTEIPMMETTCPAENGPVRTYAPAGPPNVQVCIPETGKTFWLTVPQRRRFQKLLNDSKREQLNAMIAKLCHD